MGAVFTYIAGQRAVTTKTVCTKPPLRIRIARAINRQAASPSGWLGRVLGFIWPREHGRLNIEVLDALDVQAGQRVVEIGCGSGHALREAARRARNGFVLGIDVSKLMVVSSLKTNRESVATGLVDVRVGDIASASLGRIPFERIFSVHCIYFWSDANSVLSKLAAALAPGGKLVLAFRPDGGDIPERFRDPIYRFPRAADVVTALESAGLVVESSDERVCA